MVQCLLHQLPPLPHRPALNLKSMHTNHHAYLVASLLAWGCCAVPLHAQPREVITWQEAQTPPRIERDQLQTQPNLAQAMPAASTPAGLAALQTLAQAPLASTPQQRKQQAEALWQWGLLQLHGWHVPFAPEQARHAFAQAQQLGHAGAAAGLAWCAIDGCGQRPDTALARTWIAQLRTQDPGRAAYLEWLLLEQESPLDSAAGSTTSTGQHQRLQRAKQQALARAVQANDVQAKVEWGLELAADGRTREAMQQFRQVASRSAAAQHNVRSLQQQSAPTTRTSGQLGQSGGAWQTFRQARMYHRGEGVPANYTEALRLYQRAANMGNAPARRMLALIYSRPNADGSLNIGWMQQVAHADVSQDGATPLQAPSAPNALQRDPTPLYDYIDRQWRP